MIVWSGDGPSTAQSRFDWAVSMEICLTSILQFREERVALRGSAGDQEAVTEADVYGGGAGTPSSALFRTSTP